MLFVPKCIALFTPHTTQWVVFEILYGIITQKLSVKHTRGEGEIPPIGQRVRLMSARCAWKKPELYK